MRAWQRIQLNTDGTPGVASQLEQGSIIHRGERRIIIPSPEFPDPASADPEKLLRHHLTSLWGLGESKFRRVFGERDPHNINNVDNTIGVHWSPSSSVIAARFTEHRGEAVQQGRPMEDWESRGIRQAETHDIADRLNSPTARRVRKTLKDLTIPDDYDDRYFQHYRRSEYRDLSGDRQHRGSSPSPTAAVPYAMGVIWHGKLDHSAVDVDRRVTGFESEIDLKPGSSVQIHGATLDIPSAGHRLSYAQGGTWNHIQFKEPIRALIQESSRR
jgi:hypothetical protein